MRNPGTDAAPVVLSLSEHDMPTGRDFTDHIISGAGAIIANCLVPMMNDRSAETVHG